MKQVVWPLTHKHYLAILPDLGCLLLDSPELKPPVPFLTLLVPTHVSILLVHLPGTCRETKALVYKWLQTPSHPSTSAQNKPANANLPPHLQLNSFSPLSL